MNLRHLVPVMGVLAITAGSSVFAEDKGPSVTFNGWSDNFLIIGNTNIDDTPGTAGAGTAKNEKSTGIGFASQESLKVNAKITDTVSGKINLFINPGSNVINVREGYFAWALNSDWTVQGGKYINTIGWLSPEPTGLYSPNASLIGYSSGTVLGTTPVGQIYGYGNDVVGANVAYAAKDVPVSGSLHITNGYFNAGDTGSRTAFGFTGGGNGSPATRENADLGYGLDLTYAFPKDLGNIDFDLAYDPHGGNLPVVVGVSGLGGDVLLLGLNATLKPAEGWLVGAEVIHTSTGKAKNGAKTDIDNTDFSTLQGLLLVNYALPKGTVSIPVSLTAYGEFWQIDGKANAASVTAFPVLTAGDKVKPKATDIAVAVLTNPTNSANFGLNAELAFTSYDSDVSGVKKVNTTTLSIEALIAF